MFFFQKAKEVGFTLKYRFYGYFNAIDLPKGPGAVVWLMGREMPVETAAQVDQLREEFMKIVWVTYTRDFPALEGGLTSDSGWGCMLRTGQMQLATWLRLHLGEGLPPRRVMQLLQDSDGPFGIHEVARVAREEFGLQPGEWYNPSQIMYCLQKLA
jgi:cysteine protease ATG4